jgi:hypothetical protein
MIERPVVNKGFHSELNNHKHFNELFILFFIILFYFIMQEMFMCAFISALISR